MVIAVGDDEDALVGRVLGLKLLHFVTKSQAVVAILIRFADVSQPPQERSEIRIVQPVTTADEQQALFESQGTHHRLRVFVAFDTFVIADTQDDRFRIVPLTMEVDDTWISTAKYPRNLVRLSPIHSRQSLPLTAHETKSLLQEPTLDESGYLFRWFSP